MRTFFRLGLIAGISLSSFSVHADGLAEGTADVANPAVSRAQARHEKTLDALFSQLKRESNESKAQRLASRISVELAESGSASIDLMLGWADEAIKAQKFDVALDFLDQIVVLQPDFAEVFNRRATVHFLMQNYPKSMADIERVIELEPRHFGALAGMAQILENTDRDALALSAYERVLDIYPMLRSAQEEAGRLADELADQDA